MEASDIELKQFSELLNNAMGIYYPKSNYKNLSDKLIRFCHSCGFEDVSSCLNFLTEEPFSKKMIISLAKEFTVGETYFFRHKPSFDALKHVLFSGLVSLSRPFNIWSSACCSGEEPYSLAILFDQMVV